MSTREDQHALALLALGSAGAEGLTVKDLARRYDRHDETAVMVNVLPEHVQGREVRDRKTHHCAGCRCEARS